MSALSDALESIRAKLGPITKTKEGVHKALYADLQDVFSEVVQPLLVQHEVDAFYRYRMTRDGASMLRLVLRKGEEQDAYELPLFHDDSMQSLGSAVTYARRYLLLMALNIVVTGDDDDGDKALGPDARKRRDVKERATVGSSNLSADERQEIGALALARAEELDPDRDESYNRKVAEDMLATIKRQMGIEWVERKHVDQVKARLSQYPANPDEGVDF